MKCIHRPEPRPPVQDLNDHEVWLYRAISKGLLDFADHNGDREFFLTEKGRDVIAQHMPGGDAE